MVVVLFVQDLCMFVATQDTKDKVEKREKKSERTQCLRNSSDLSLLFRCRIWSFDETT